MNIWKIIQMLLYGIKLNLRTIISLLKYFHLWVLVKYKLWMKKYLNQEVNWVHLVDKKNKLEIY
jgi:hypothetical protein